MSSKVVPLALFFYQPRMELIFVVSASFACAEERREK